MQGGERDPNGAVMLAKIVDTLARSTYAHAMEITLTTEQEAQLFEIAALEGKGADEVAREVLLRGLKDGEAALAASRRRSSEGLEAAARILELRQGNMLPEGVTIKDLIGEGRA